ncbi:hypothetical protein, partial [Bacteroides sp. AM23-12]|uniref:hypothetical protein n=1 Tax=Bacteroides sp. AM23-12 TaxID=2292942 RepID=UPI0018F57916
SGRLSGCFLVYPDSRFTASTAQRNIKIPVVYPFDYQRVVHCLSTRRFVASGHGVRTGKGLLLCRRKPKWNKNGEERQPPEGVPRHSAAGKG